MKFLEKNGLKTAQTCFRDIFQNNIHRNYADDLLAWLERETDFFEAPASTRNHGAHPGGLLVHSLNVYRRLRAIVCVETYGDTTSSDLLAGDVEETVAILGLLHDVCKVNCYHTETRRRYGLPYEVKRVFFTGGARK